MHAAIGGSVAQRVIACPGSVPLSKQMPPRKSGQDADAGSLLHEAVALILEGKLTPDTAVGLTFNDIELTPEMRDERLTPALAMFDEVAEDLEFVVEQRVSYAPLIPDSFGTADILGRRGTTAVVADWKFGSGIISAIENDQMAFYLDAARLTPGLEWVFEGATQLEFMIIQPAAGAVSRWTAPLEHLDQFRRRLLLAVKLTEDENPPLATGSQCRWCAAKPICPLMTGEAQRAVAAALDGVGDLGPLLALADKLEGWTKSVQALALDALENGRTVTGYKVVQKRATRRWVDETKAASTLAGAGIEPYTQSLISPAVAEKALKAKKLPLPSELVVSVSSGNTVAPADDPRPAVSTLGQQLKTLLTVI